MTWTPKFIFALVLIIGCLGLIFTGIDGEVKSVLLMASGWAFGTQYEARKANGG